MPERHHRSILRTAALGLLLSPGAPLGLWALCEWFEVSSRSSSSLEFALIYSGISTAIVFTAFGAWAGHAMDRLRELSVRDGLTGLFNRRFLCESLPNLQAAARRRGEPLCLLMLDLDHFKQVNDRYGHVVGDQTLRAIGEVLVANARQSDLVARYGGEEFAVVCPATDGPTAAVVAERLRGAIERLGTAELGRPGPQTVSIGIAVQADELSADSLMDRADLALYRAKAAGRNTIVVSD